MQTTDDSDKKLLEPALEPIKKPKVLQITPEQHPDIWKTLQPPSDKYPEPEHKDHRIR